MKPRSEPTLSVEQIVQRYAPGLRAYISGKVDSREDSEDILQEVFFRLARSESFPGGGIERVSAWLYTVARNLIINSWRRPRENSLSAYFLNDEQEACRELSETLLRDPANDPDNLMLRKLIWKELDAALAELPPGQSEIFCLTMFEGIPVKQIAASTGIPQATLLSRKHYAVKHLRHRLKNLYDELLESF